MKSVPALAALLPVFLAASCGHPSSLEVRPLHLKEIETGAGDDPMVRGERMRLLHGAVGVNEQIERLGHYYTVLWQDDTGGGAVEVVFEYRQGATGSRVKRMSQVFPAGADSGKAEFAITGEDYRKGGKVLAWRCRLFRDGREVASRHSYLWQ